MTRAGRPMPLCSQPLSGNSPLSLELEMDDESGACQLGTETEAVEVVVARGGAPSETEEPIGELPLSGSTRVIRTGAARSMSRRKRHALAAGFAV